MFFSAAGRSGGGTGAADGEEGIISAISVKAEKMNGVVPRAVPVGVLRIIPVTSLDFFMKVLNKQTARMIKELLRSVNISVSVNRAVSDNS